MRNLEGIHTEAPLSVTLRKRKGSLIEPSLWKLHPKRGRKTLKTCANYLIIYSKSDTIYSFGVDILNNSIVRAIRYKVPTTCINI